MLLITFAIIPIQSLYRPIHRPIHHPNHLYLPIHRRMALRTFLLPIVDPIPTVASSEFEI